MTATFEEANNEILDVFQAAWGPTGNTAVFDNKKGEKPAATASWARVTVRHTGGNQASLANVGGQRRWSRDGIITVQVFVPAGEGLSGAYALAKIVADAYEGTATPSAVWFRNVRVNEIGESGHWFQVNVLAEFTYDEVK